MRNSFLIFGLLTFILFIFSSNTPDPLEKGLIAYYSFNECDARDDTGNGSDGILYGDMGCACGVDDDALVFDGLRDYVEFEGMVNDYFTTSDFSVSFYFKSNKYSPFQQSLLSKRSFCDENNMMDIQLNIARGFIDTDLYESPQKYYKDISPELDSTVWVHYAVVREGARAKTFINGQLRRTSFRCSGVDLANDAILSFSNSPCLRGGRSVKFKGVLDELRVYDRALAEEEIFALYSRAPVEMAEIDCVTFAPKNFPPLMPEAAESTYLCGAFN